MKAFTDSRGHVHPIRESKGYSPAKGGTAPGVTGLRAYAKSKGLTVHTVPDKNTAKREKGYKYNIRGSGSGIYGTSMWARGLTDAKKLIAHSQKPHEPKRVKMGERVYVHSKMGWHPAKVVGVDKQDRLLVKGTLPGHTMVFSFDRDKVKRSKPTK